jgi:predicted nucleic acid-binding protein
VKIEVNPADVIEECRSTVTGTTDPTSCAGLDAAGQDVRSEFGGDEHMAFAIRHHGASRAPTFTISVSYTAADSYVQITPPAGAPGTTIVAFTPRSSTVGAHANSLTDIGTVADASVEVSQQGSALMLASPCDFASEIGCVGGVTPDEAVMVALTSSPSDADVTFFVTWACLLQRSSPDCSPDAARQAQVGLETGGGDRSRLEQLRYGAVKAGWGEPRQRGLERDLACVVIVQPDDQLMQVCAELRVGCERAGLALGQKVHEADRWIAATAMRLGVELISDDGCSKVEPANCASAYRGYGWSDVGRVASRRGGRDGLART